MKNFSTFILSCLLLTTCSVQSFATEGDIFKMWGSAFTAFEQAEEIGLSGDKKGALKAFENALNQFIKIKQKDPKWNKVIISSRIKLCERRIAALKAKLKAGATPKPSVDFAPIPKSSLAKPAPPAFQTQAPLAQPAQPTSSLASNLISSIAAIENQLKDYKSRYANALVEIDRLKQEHQKSQQIALQVQSILKEKKEIVHRYTLLSEELNNLKSQKSKEAEELQKWKSHFANERVNNQALKQELNTMMQANASMRKQVTSGSKIKAQFDSQLKAKEATISDLNDKLNKIASTINKQTQEIKQLQEKSKGFEQEKKTLEAIISRKSSEVQSLNKKIQDLSKKADTSGLVQKLQQENQTLKQQNGTLVTQVDSLSKAKNELNQKLTAKTTAYDKNNTILINISKQHDILRNDLTALKQKYKQAQTQALADQKAFAALQQTNKSLSAEMNALAQKMKPLYDKAQKTDELLKQKTVLEGKINQLQAAKQPEAEAVKQLQAQLNAAKATSQKLSLDNQSLRKSYAGIQARLAQMSKNPPANEEAKKLASENVTLKQLIQKIKQDNTALKNAAKMASSPNEQQQKLLTANKQLTAQLATLKQENASLKKAAEQNSLQLQKYTTELTKLKQRAEESKQVMTEYNKEINNLKTQFMANNQKLNGYTKEIANLKLKYKSETDKLAQEKETLRKDLTTRDETIKRITAEHQTMQKNALDLNKKIRLLTAEIDNTKKQLASTQTSRSREHDAMIKQHTKERQTLAAQLKQKEQQITQLKAAQKATQGKISELQTKASQANSSSQKQTATLTSLRQQVTTLSKELQAQKAAAGKGREAQQQLTTLNTTIKQKNKEIEALKKALNAARETTQATPDRKVIRMLRTTAIESENKNDLEAAIWHYRKIIDIDKKNLEALKKLGTLYARQRDLQSAITYYESAYKVNNNDLETLLALGILYKEAKKTRLALAILNKALSQQPKNSIIHKSIGDVCTQLNWLDAAEKEYKKALELNPKSASANLAMAKFLASRYPQKRSEAQRYYETAKRLGAKVDSKINEMLR